MRERWTEDRQQEEAAACQPVGRLVVQKSGEEREPRKFGWEEERTEDEAERDATINDFGATCYGSGCNVPARSGISHVAAWAPVSSPTLGDGTGCSFPLCAHAGPHD